MSTLTNTQIQNTYQGLLKLADSTTGITSNFQQIQDGLGNDTGITIAEDYLAAPNIYNALPLKNDYFGLGVGASGIAPVAGSQNIVIAQPFYDTGLYSYSAFSYNVNTLSNTDTTTLAFYTAQYVPGIGLGPHQLIQSGITLDNTSTGFKTTTLPSHLSFSGYGGGLYFLCWKIANSGVTPTIRYTTTVLALASVNTQFWRYGFTINAAGTGMSPITKRNGLGNATNMYSSLANFQTTFSQSDISTISGTDGPTYGWGLNTVV